MAHSDEEIARLEHRVKELEELIWSPKIDEFFESVRIEAAHQKLRWKDYDPHKTATDWFWTAGYLLGKAIRPDQPEEKRLHHIISTAAMLLNWYHSETQDG